MATVEQAAAFRRAAGRLGVELWLSDEQLAACLDEAERAAWRPIAELPGPDGPPVLAHGGAGGGVRELGPRPAAGPLSPARLGYAAWRPMPLPPRPGCVPPKAGGP